MRKIIFILFAAITAFTLSACSTTAKDTKLLPAEGVSHHESISPYDGIAPYVLTDREKYLLQSFDLGNDWQIVGFKAPQKVITLKVNIYHLDNNGKWKKSDGGAISIGADREPIKTMDGVFTMKTNKDYSIDFIISAGGGRATYHTNQLTPEASIAVSEKVFLGEYQKIEINKEIPVALMIYDSGTCIGGFSLQDYFEPSKLKEMAFVQAVTLTFSDKPIQSVAN